MPTFSAADGTQLAYTKAGEGPPLLCQPGGPGRAGAYLEDLAGLTDGRTVVVLDTRATGRSEVPADPSSLRFDRLAEDLEALREHLGLETAEPDVDARSPWRYWIVGHQCCQRDCASRKER